MEKNLGIILNREAELILRTASDLAENCEFVSLEHVLLALVENQSIQNILNSYHVDLKTLKKELNEFLKTQIPPQFKPSKRELPDFTLAFLRLLQRADIQVHGSGQNEVTLNHLLIALFEEKESFAVYFLEKQGITQFDIIYYTTHGSLPQQDITDPLTTPLEKHRRKTSEKRKLSSSPQVNIKTSSPIQQFTADLNQRARSEDLQSLLKREDILNKMIQVLSRKTKNNPLLVGDAGVGKTTLALQLAHRIVFKEVPEKLKNSVIYSLDIGSMLAGTKYRGDFEERFKALIAQFKDESEHIILFIDDIHNLVGAGGTAGSSIDASNLLKPSLSDGTLSCIGTTTYKESRQRFEKDRGLVRRFQKIEVLEPNSEKTLQILTGIKKKYELFHKVFYTQSSLKSIVNLSGRYLRERRWPDKAIDVMDEVGAHLKLKNKKASEPKVLIRDVEKVVSEIAQLPLNSISSSDKQKLFHLESSLKSVIFGQDMAIQYLVSSIKKARVGIRKANKPIGNYLFSGPTGVGKTEMAKQLACHLGIHFIRFDMSEYMEKHSVARLVGAPPGYVGHEEGGLLTEQIKQHPYAVLLMDEIEKAHLDLTNILLQVMDSGRLTDSSGNVIDFSHVLLIMTSNAGAFESQKQGLGIRPDTKSERSLNALKHAFRPEFLNRLDAVVEFKALQKPVLFMVIKKFMNELSEQLREKRVQLRYTDELIEWLFKKGYSPDYGARAFERAVDQYVKDPLVDDLLFGRLSHGGSVTVKLKDESLDFSFTKQGF